MASTTLPKHPITGNDVHGGHDNRGFDSTELQDGNFKNRADTPSNSSENRDENVDTPSNSSDISDTNVDTPSNITVSIDENVDTPSNTTDSIDENVDTLSNLTDSIDENVDTPNYITDSIDENVDTPSNIIDSIDENVDTSNYITVSIDENVDTPSNITDSTDENVDTPNYITDSIDENVDTPSNSIDVGHDAVDSSEDVENEASVNREADDSQDATPSSVSDSHVTQHSRERVSGRGFNRVHHRRRNHRRRQQVVLPSHNVDFTGLTPPPPALVSSTIHGERHFKHSLASKLAALQLLCGIAELVCGFGISEGVNGDQLPFCFQTMMPLWTGALYLMTSVVGSVAVNSRRKGAISFFLIFALITLCLSILLCSFILPDVTKYDTQECYDATDGTNGTSSSDENSLIKCNEAHLMAIFAYVSLAFGFIDAIDSFAICILCGRALCKYCAKPNISILQEAPVFFGVGDDGEIEANIMVGRNNPVVVPLPRYEDVIEVPSHQSPRTLVEVPSTPSPRAPSTPPPAYSSMMSSSSPS